MTTVGKTGAPALSGHRRRLRTHWSRANFDTWLMGQTRLAASAMAFAVAVIGKIT